MGRRIDDKVSTSMIAAVHKYTTTFYNESRFYKQEAVSAFRGVV